jgi:hypothetical protein
VTAVAAELLLAASVLGELVREVVFVGGYAVPVWITEPGAPAPRATDDIDVVCDLATYGEYQTFGDRLRDQGLVEDAGSNVICRWQHRPTGLVIDVMPSAEAALGFANRWYGLVLDTAESLDMGGPDPIRVARPDVLLATKLEAWKGRGNGDILSSIDLGDVVTLIDGRPELAAELRSAPRELRSFVLEELSAVLVEPYFDYLVQDVASKYGVSVAAARADVLRGRISDVLEAGGNR